MAKYLATFNDTLGDVEVNGFTVMSEKDMERYENLAYSITWDFSYRIGSEKLEYTSGEDLLSRIEFKELSSEDVKSVKKLFNNQFGTFIGEDFLGNVVGGDVEEEEWEEEDEDYGYKNDDDDNDDY